MGYEKLIVSRLAGEIATPFFGLSLMSDVCLAQKALGQVAYDIELSADELPLLNNVVQQDRPQSAVESHAAPVSSHSGQTRTSARPT